MNTSIKLFYYNLKTAFYKIATDRTTVSDLCYILDNDRNYVINHSDEQFNSTSSREEIILWENLIQKDGLPKDKENFKKYNVLVADLNGSDILNINKQDMWALILGSEAHGINPIFENFPKITIPKTGKVESLNVSVSSGIILNQLIQK